MEYVMHVKIVFLGGMDLKWVLLKKQPPKQVHLKEQPLLMDPHKGLDLLPLPK